MAKWFGAIGYAETVETAPGVWDEQITKHNYYGDILSNSSRWDQNQNSTNDNINVNNRISIVADPFAMENFYKMRFIEFMGANRKITNVQVQYPRLVITMGGVWNGNA